MTQRNTGGDMKRNHEVFTESFNLAVHDQGIAGAWRDRVIGQVAPWKDGAELPSKPRYAAAAYQALQVRDLSAPSFFIRKRSNVYV